MNYNGRMQRIEQVCDRLRVLLNQESDPVAMMRWLEEVLMAADVSRVLPTDEVGGFCLDLEAVLRECNPDLLRLPENVMIYEDAEALIMDMLTSDGHLE